MPIFEKVLATFSLLFCEHSYRLNTLSD